MATVIRIICPNLMCRTILSVPSSARGKDVRCSSCGSKVRIPIPKSSAGPMPPSAGAAAGEPPADKGGEKKV